MIETIYILVVRIHGTSTYQLTRITDQLGLVAYGSHSQPFLDKCSVIMA